jgi:uncharacterized protein YjbI with pentapeptide repeats
MDQTAFSQLLGRRTAGESLVLADVELSGIVAVEQDLSSAEFVRCRFVDASFERCDLSYSTLIDSSFEKGRLIRCNLRKADLRSANLRNVDLSQCDLSRCDLTDADLRGADLTGCVLDGAWLVGADLRDAILENTSFSGARLLRTKLHNRRRFELGSCDNAIVEDVDVSPEGTGRSVSGVELWTMLGSPGAATGS